jgi:mannose-6-phosphate isomerase-like protein (cupin superfamily)
MKSWAIKAWGRTRELVTSPYYSKHELRVVQGGYCSLHYHKERANRFIILSGLVEVVTMFGPFCERKLVGPDNSYDVPSLVPHMFIVRRTGVMIEEYYPDRGGKVRDSDIVRLVEGGRLDPKNLDSLPCCLFQGLECFGIK